MVEQFPSTFNTVRITLNLLCMQVKKAPSTARQASGYYIFIVLSSQLSHSEKYSGQIYKVQKTAAFKKLSKSKTVYFHKFPSS